MGFWRGTRKVAGQIIDVRADKWLGIESIKNITKDLSNAVGSVFKVAQPERIETFTEALIRLNLTTEDLAKQKTQFKFCLKFFLLITFIIFIYCIYETVTGNLNGAFLCLALTFSGLAKSFYYHFWIFQIDQERLGLTWRDWYRFHLLGKKL